ncbi:MAG: hypothetical protein R3F35_14945 [Myxococcota bacterium]
MPYPNRRRSLSRPSTRSVLRCPRRAASVAFCLALIGVVGIAGDATAALRVAVEARPDPVRPGETVHVVVRLSNDGTTNVVSASLAMTLPAEIEPFAESLVTGLSNCNAGADPSLCEPGEVIASAFGTLQPGEGVSISFPAIVLSGGSAPADGTSIVFSATGSATSQTPVDANGTVVVESSPALDVTLEPERDPVVQGESLTYHLHFANKTAATALAGTTLSVPVPADTTFASASDGGVLNVGTVEWSLGTLAPGASGARSFTVTVGAGATSGTVLAANATLAGGAPLRTARAVARTRVQASEELDLRIAPALDPTAPGEPQTTLVQVTNDSPFASASVVVALRLPDWVAAFAESDVIGLANCNQGIDASLCEPGEQVVWTLGTLTAGQGQTLAFPMQVRDDGLAPGDGELVSLQAIVNDSGNRYATVQRSFAVAPAASLGVSLEPERSLVPPGDALAYRLRYANRGLVASPATELEVVLPLGASFVSATGGGLLAGSRVTWALGSLAAGEAGEVGLVVDAPAGVPNGAALELRARLSNGAAPAAEARALAFGRVSATSEPVLALEIAADPVAPGERITGRVVASNASVNSSGSSTVYVILPDAIEAFDEDSLIGLANCNRGADASLCEPGERIEWSFGTLVPGNARTGGFSTRVAASPNAPDDGSLLRFEAIFLDSANRDAHASRAVPVETDGALVLSLADARDPVEQSAELAYRIDVGNRRSAGIAPDVVVEVPVPRGTSFVEAGEGGVLVGDAVQWQLGDLAAGDSRVLSLALAADPGLASGSLIQAVAYASDASAPAASTTSPQATRASASADQQVSIELNPDPASAGERVTALVSVTNRAAVNVASVALSLTLPEAIEAFEESSVVGLSNCNRGANASLCEPGETVEWSFGTLNPGEGRTGEISLRVASDGAAPANGDLLRFEAVASDSGNRASNARAALPIAQDAGLTLAIDDESDPVHPGDALTYRIPFANTRANPPSPGIVVRMRVPESTSFASASAGGVLDGDVVEWSPVDLDDLPGEVTLTVTVDPSAAEGSSIRGYAWIENAASTTDRAQAEVRTRVETAPGLVLDVDAVPTVVGPNQVVDLTFSATNETAVNAGSVAISARLPDFVVPFAESSVTPLANCNRGADAALCEPGEQIEWSLGTLNAGANTVRNATVTLVPPEGGLPAGDVVRFEAVLTDSVNREAVATRSLPEPVVVVGLISGAVALAAAGRQRRRPSR